MIVVCQIFLMSNQHNPLPCPACGFDLLTNLRAVDMNVGQPKFDDILLCGECGQINTMGLLSPQKMEQADVDKLNPRR